MGPRLIKMSAMDGCGLVVAWMPVFATADVIVRSLHMAVQHSNTLALVNSMQIILWLPIHPSNLILEF